MPTNISNERLSIISDCCDQAFETLNEIRNKVLQIIDYKKNAPQAAGDELIRRQVSTYMIALENLSSINKNLDGAVQEVKQLCQEARLLLGKGLEANKGMGLGMGGSSAAMQEEGNEKGGGK